MFKLCYGTNKFFSDTLFELLLHTLFILLNCLPLATFNAEWNYINLYKEGLG